MAIISMLAAGPCACLSTTKTYSLQPSSIRKNPTNLQGFAFSSNPCSSRRSGIKSVICMAPDEKLSSRSPLDFPLEWETPRYARMPEIIPKFSPMKTPIPCPMPSDPPDPFEEEEDEEKEEQQEEEENPEENPENPEPGF